MKYNDPKRATGVIDIAKIVNRATQFYLGMHVVYPGQLETVPVYLEHVTDSNDSGWTVRAQMGGMNPHYLNANWYNRTPTERSYWRYKGGTLFASVEEALEHFNRVVYNNPGPPIVKSVMRTP